MTKQLPFNTRPTQKESIQVRLFCEYQWELVVKKNVHMEYVVHKNGVNPTLLKWHDFSPSILIRYFSFFHCQLETNLIHKHWFISDERHTYTHTNTTHRVILTESSTIFRLNRYSNQNIFLFFFSSHYFCNSLLSPSFSFAFLAIAFLTVKRMIYLNRLQN